MNLDLPRRALWQYGVADPRLTELGGGTINRVWRVDTSNYFLVLKEYRPDFPEVERLAQIFAARQAAEDHGLPVPSLVPNRRGATITWVDHHAYVLTRYIEGRLHAPGRVTAVAARNMGVVLARLHDALLSLAPDESPEGLPSLQAIEVDLRGLLVAARSHRDNPVDAVAEGVLEAKLDLLSTIESVPAVTSQWTHGDYEWRNVLFDERDEVAAVIDFDNANYYPPERDVMRCIALSFPALEPEADFFFEGYAAVRKVSPSNVAAYVELYRYLSTFRVWPIRERYLRPDRYQPRWDVLIRPFVAWDWQALRDRLEEAASRAAGNGRPDSLS